MLVTPVRSAVLFGLALLLGVYGLFIASNIAMAVPDLPKPPQPKPSFPKPPEPLAEIDRPEPARRLTSAQLDTLFQSESEATKSNSISPKNTASDEIFLRRVSLDLIGRQPTPDEQRTFLADSSPDKRARAIDRLLANEAFGRNWANYWSDVISYRIPQPELTFLEYDLFKNWMAGRINQGASWAEITREILTASGKVKEHPAATFVGFQQANPIRLAGQTSRVFLSVQIKCAECHDHPMQDWQRKQFHGLAAYFARTEAKLPWRESSGIEVKSKKKGEYLLPDLQDAAKKGKPVVPISLNGKSFKLGASDAERRAALANWVTYGNPWFAGAYVNRIWGRLMGRAFYEPVDVLPDTGAQRMPKLHKELSAHFSQSGHDIKGLFRLIANSNEYQRRDGNGSRSVTMRIRGDQVFDSLVAAIAIPNITPPAIKHNDAFRFPPPAKNTRGLVNASFGFDPSLRAIQTGRTMQQAMWMMNNDQLLKQIDAKPDNNTRLAKILLSEPDDARALERLYVRVLARKPTEKEAAICRDHLKSAENRSAGFEDILWSLINSAEFTTRR